MITSALMPNTRSAAKRMRADATCRLRNLGANSELKTLTRQFTRSVEEKKADQAKKIYPLLTRLLDQSARKGILHRKTASRKKSRLAIQLSKLG